VTADTYIAPSAENQVQDVKPSNGVPVTCHLSPVPSAALYIHWPFCKKKCPYCDFNSHVREGVDHAAWRAAMLREMGYWHARAPEKTITSIFFGGGTPSLMEATTVEALINEAYKLWPTAAGGCEITLEANPTSVEAAKFAALKAAGVNRVSLGVQSLRPESLAFLGREHTASEALEAVALAAKTFDRYSFDLIYALPNQTLGEWENELREALTYASGHLSLYQLTIEENTAFHHAYHVGKSFQLPEDSLAAEMYTLTQRIMEEAGLPAYEISNHASAGQESRHNLSYWRSDSYFGIGPGAHGRVDLHKGHNDYCVPLEKPEANSDAAREINLYNSMAVGGSYQKGHNNHCVPFAQPFAQPLPLASSHHASPRARLATRTQKSPERWLDAVQRCGHGVEEELALCVSERAEEAILMGLRLREGVNLAALPPDISATLAARWADGRVERLVAQGLLEASRTTLCATPRGMLVLNTVIEALLA
jgi:putative oxygen-independent coproporphyrinogen III oxidase